MERNRPPFEGWPEYLSVTGLAALGVSGLAYLMARHMGSQAHALEAARPLEYLEDIKQMVPLLPLLVAVRGRVNSRLPKQCELCDKKAVIHEMVEHEIWRKERDGGRTVHEPVEIRRATDQAEWYLDDGSSVTVRVDNSLDADHVRTAMEVRSAFKPDDLSGGNIAKLILDKVASAIKTGVRRTETFLPVGNIVTVVGELGANGVRTPHPMESARRALPGGGGTHASSHPYILRKPGGRGPFYITPLTLSQLHTNLSNAARTYKMVSFGFGALAAALIISKATRCIITALRARRLRRRVLAAEAQRKAQQLQQQQQRAAAAAAAGGGPAAASDDTHPSAPPLDERPADTCVVCLEGNADMVFTACGHMCCCFACGYQLNRCPICRVKSPSIRVYRP